MAAPLFTLKSGEGFHTRLGTSRAALSGAKIVLKSSINKGELLVIDSYMEAMEKVVTYLDEDGKLNGDTGIQLLANDDSLNLGEPFEWQVQISGETRGYTRVLKEWSFEAPAAGAVYSLEQDIPVPGQDRKRGSAAAKIVGGTVEGGTLTLINQDATTIGPIEIPNGATVLVNNHDGTWSVA